MRGAEEGGCRVERAGESLLLHPERALIWPAHRTLFMADLHLGKAAIFRRHGIPIPEGATAEDLRRLDGLIESQQLRRIILLGDFLHGPSDDAAAHLREFREWRDRHRDVQFVVVAGNHDRRSAGRELADAVQWEQPDWQAGPFICRHHPGVSAQGYVLSGHVHPVIRLRGSSRERARVPVCWMSADCAVLPSFGSFTGGCEIEPAERDDVYAFAAGRVWSLPTATRR